MQKKNQGHLNEDSVWAMPINMPSIEAGSTRQWQGVQVVGSPVLSIIVPVYNESATLDKLLQQIIDLQIDKQIIVIDDGSNDGSSSILNRWAGRVEICSHTTNQGKGAAIRTALRFARGRFTVIQDADLEYSPEDFTLLIQPAIVSRSRVAVYGSRNLPNSQIIGRWKLLPYLCERALNLVVRSLYGCRLTDVLTCYKLLPTDVLLELELKCEGFEFCMEVTAKLCRLGVSIHEVPIQYVPRTLKEGKKIRWWHAIAMFRTLWRYRHWMPRSTARTSNRALA